MGWCLRRVLLGSMLALGALLWACDSDPVGAPGPMMLNVVSGANQSGFVSTALREPVILQVTDSRGNPRSQVAIEVEPADGSGSVPQSTVTSDAEGKVHLIWTLGGMPGSNLLRASLVQQPNVSVEIQAVLPVTFDLPANLRTWPGDVVSLGQFLFDHAGTAVPRAFLGDVEWSSTHLVEVVEDTLLVGAAEGRGSLSASVPDLDVTQEIALTVATKVEIEAVTLNGESMPSDYFLFLATDQSTDSVAGSPDGSFTLRAEEPLGGSMGRLWIDAGGDRERAFFPLVREEEVIPSRPLSAALIPRNWTLQGGRWAGEAIPISLFDGFGGDIGGTRAFLRPHGLGSWRVHDFPIPVWFERFDVLPEPYEHQREITPADSAQIWWYIENMHERLGKEIFRPAHEGELQVDSFYWTHPASDEGRWITYVAKSVTISALRYIGGNPTGGVAICRQDLPQERVWSSACEAHGFPPFEAIRGGINLPIEIVQHMRSVQHELLHALNFGHTQFFCSIMSYSWIPTVHGGRCEDGERYRETTPWRDRPEPGLTPFDAAYFWMWVEINELHHSLDGLDFGIVEAYRGQRQLMKEHDDPDNMVYRSRARGDFGPY